MTAEMDSIRIVADMKQCLAIVPNTDLHLSTAQRVGMERKLPKSEYAVQRVLFLKLQARVRSSGHLSPVHSTCSNFGSELIVVVQLHDQQRVEVAELSLERLVVVAELLQEYLDDILPTTYCQSAVAAVQTLA